jgi:hypothetical protein
VGGLVSALAALVMALVVAGLGQAAALPRPGSAGAGVASAAVAPTIELVRQPAYVRPGEPYGVEVRVTDPPAGAQVAMVVHDRLQSRQQFRTTLTGELGGVEQAIDPQPLDALPRGPAGSVTVGFTPGPGGPGGSRPSPASSPTSRSSPTGLQSSRRCRWACSSTSARPPRCSRTARPTCRTARSTVPARAPGC